MSPTKVEEKEADKTLEYGALPDKVIKDKEMSEKTKQQYSGLPVSDEPAVPDSTAAKVNQAIEKKVSVVERVRMIEAGEKEAQEEIKREKQKEVKSEKPQYGAMPTEAIKEEEMSEKTKEQYSGLPVSEEPGRKGPGM